MISQGEPYDVIVVGAGPAGNTAANSCSKTGLRTLLIEKCQLLRLSSVG